MGNEKKYDTNPLDPEALRRAEKARNDDDSTRHLPGRDTLGHGALAEDAPTRRWDAGAGYEPYQSVYQGPQSPSAPYQTPYAPPPVNYPNTYQMPPSAPPATIPNAPVSPTGKPTGRAVAGLNMPENLLVIAPYIPFWVGAVAALIELFVIPRHEKRARFHAAQGLALHLAITVITTVLSLARTFGSAIGGWTGLLGVAAGLFQLASLIYLIVYLIKAWKGEAEPVAPLKDVTAWLEANIAPKDK